MSKHFQFESVLSLTGANSDVRVKIKPSEEILVASSILSSLNNQNSNSSLNEATNEKVQSAVKYLLENKGNSLVVAGSNDPNVQMLVNKIIYQLDNYGKTIDVDNEINLFNGNDEAVDSFQKELLSGKIDGVIFYGVNPVYSMSNGSEISEAISKLDFSVSFSEFMDETASACQFVCPDHNYLESWCDLNPGSNNYSLQQPLIRPLYNTRQAQESLLVWSGLAERSNSESQAFYDYMRKYWLDNSIGNDGTK